MDPLLLVQIALTLASLAVIFLWFWQVQPISEAGGRVSTPALILSLWIVSSELLHRSFFTVRVPGLLDLTIERVLFVAILFFLIAGLFQGRVRFEKNISIEIAMGMFLLVLFVSMIQHGFSASMPSIPDPSWQTSLSAPGSGPKPSYTFQVGYFIPFLCFVFAKHYLVTEKDVSCLLHALFYFGVYLSIISYFEFADLRQFVYPQYINDPENLLHLERARGPFLNSGINGGAILFGFISGVHLLQKKTDFARVFHLTMLLLFFPAVYFTQTRCVYLGFVATLIILGGWYKTSVEKWKLASLPIALVCILMIVYAGSGRLMSEDRRAGGIVQMSEMAIRLNLLDKSFALFQDAPIFGIGLSQFMTASTISLKPPARPFELEDVQSQFQHNHILGIATELGLVGLTVYLMLLILIFRRLKQLVGKLPKEGLLGDNLRFIILSGWCIYIIINMFLTPEHHLFFNATPFIFAGLLDGIYTRSLERGKSAVG